MWKVGKSVISLSKKVQKGQMHFNMAVKSSCFAIFYSCFKDSEFTAVKRDAKY